MTKIFFRSGKIVAIVVLVVCSLLALGGAIYYFLVYARGQGSPTPVDPVQQETVDDLESKVKGVNVSDPVPADELDPVKDTIGL